MAAEGGHKNIVDYLVNERADISMKDNDGVSQMINVHFVSVW